MNQRTAADHSPIRGESPRPVIGYRAAMTARVILLFIVPAVLLAVAADALVVWINTEAALDPLRKAIGLGRYNTRIVVMAAGLLGCAGGVVGSFLLLRKRSLVTDALAHAMLPGVAGAFIVVSLLHGATQARSLGALMTGAVIAALLAMVAIMLIRSQTRIKEDAALGIVLSVFYGGGVVLLGIAGRMPEAGVAGLEHLLLGRAASLRMEDLRMVAVVSAITIWTAALLFKEMTLLCFDRGFAVSQGMHATWVDATMMMLVIAVTMVGLKAVGMILIIAMLIIPPAAARFWTDRLPVLVMLSAAIGTIGGIVGVLLSSHYADLPTGAIIVLCTGGCFLISVGFGRARGLLPAWIRRRNLRLRISGQNLLRALYEQIETNPGRAEQGVDVPQLLTMRSWSHHQLNRLIARAQRGGLIRGHGDERISLTAAGRVEAAQLTRRHRLWEMFLITHADIAPSHVDRDADQIEHILGAEMVEKLESLLDAQPARPPVPRSPHGPGILEPDSEGGAP
ncbi:MAG: metal ABC transporter permease [Phycisphaeraceae bacterium]|nr:metal ABC transporter permease [Phycisphaeraceae bacterium]